MLKWRPPNILAYLKANIDVFMVFVIMIKAPVPGRNTKRKIISMSATQRLKQTKKSVYGQ